MKRRRHLSPEQKLAARTKWKPLFDEEIHKTFRAKLRRDVIVRDIHRIDHYPNTESGKGISPWFRVGLLGTYHRGIQLGLGIKRLTFDDASGGWRYTDYDAGETGEQNVITIGNVPFEAIEDVDWDGDEFYDYPHIYCHFEHKREPYEKTALYVEHVNPSSGNPPFYVELEDYETVRRRSLKLGLKY